MAESRLGFVVGDTSSQDKLAQEILLSQDRNRSNLLLNLFFCFVLWGGSRATSPRRGPVNGEVLARDKLRASPADLCGHGFALIAVALARTVRPYLPRNHHVVATAESRACV